MTPADLDEIERRASAATEGPWTGREVKHRDPDGRVIGVELGAAHDDHAAIFGANPEADAEFIAAARTDVPRLVAEVRRLQAENENLRVIARHLDEGCGFCFEYGIDHCEEASKLWPRPEEDE